MRVLRTVAELNERGWNRDYLRRGERHGRWRRIVKGVYGEGPEPPSPLDVARATAYAVSGVGARGLAGVLLGLDSVTLADGVEILLLAGESNRRPGVRRVKQLPDATIEIAQVRCTDG
ncbi:MAG TPA: type IV toxin-antitoxin system AbiEi family antitoxin domain-containing protein, partial [Acidimicrobiales bacterium]|nr:type IV toxin-antitoxin system AbiEi family antitoxin domain-containing protein [Acidimicrobiales bacterium]